MWFEKNGIGSLYKKLHHNFKDEQPHLYKERLIKELKLDYYIEDDPLIVKYLRGKVDAKIVSYNLETNNLEKKLSKNLFEKF